VVPAEVYVADASSLGFDAEPVRRFDGAVLLRPKYGFRGKAAHFTIEFGPSKSSGTLGQSSVPLKTGEGRFVAEPGSDASHC